MRWFGAVVTADDSWTDADNYWLMLALLGLAIVGIPLGDWYRSRRSTGDQDDGD